MDTETECAACLFLKLISDHYDLAGVLLFGSRARHDGGRDSDADIAVLLRGASGARGDAAVAIAGIAFDVMLETGVLVDAIPFWEEERIRGQGRFISSAAHIPVKQQVSALSPRVTTLAAGAAKAAFPRGAWEREGRRATTEGGKM